MTTDDQNPLRPWDVNQDDAVAFLSSLRPGSVHLGVTDHAYPCVEKHRKLPSGKPRGTTVRLSESKGSSNKWFPIFPDALLPGLFAAYHRCLARDAHLYMMSASDHDQVDVMVRAGRAAGFTHWKNIIWDKGPMIGMGYHWRSRYEVILMFEKGKRRLRHLGWPDVINVPSLRGKGLYPTEKPPEVFGLLVENSSLPGETVVDPFVGSGSCGEAALRMGRRFLGADVDDDAVGRSRARLETARSRGHLVLPLKVNEPVVTHDEEI